MNTILDTQDTAYDIIKISTSIDHGEMSANKAGLYLFFIIKMAYEIYLKECLLSML